MRLFYLFRETDSTGKSGVGFVAQGVRFDDGRVCMRWLTSKRSTVQFDDVDSMKDVHCHPGTHVIWDDLDFVDKDGRPCVWASEGFYTLGVGGPWWPRAEDFTDLVRPDDWVRGVRKDPDAALKYQRQIDRAIASAVEHASTLDGVSVIHVVDVGSHK